MGNFSRDTFDQTKHYVDVRLQQGVPLVDADWNEMESIRRFEQQSALRWYLGDGVPDGNDGFRITAPADASANNFLIKGGNGTPDGAGRCLVAGWEVLNEVDCAYTAQALLAKPELAQQWNVEPLTAISTPTTPGNYDIVYLDLWEREVNFREDPGLVDSRIGVDVETCVRTKREWVVRVLRASTSNIRPVPPAGSAHRFYPLAVIARAANNGIIRAGDITDLRFTGLTMKRSFGTTGVVDFAALSNGPTFENISGVIDPKLGAGPVGVILAVEPDPPGGANENKVVTQIGPVGSVAPFTMFGSPAVVVAALIDTFAGTFRIAIKASAARGLTRVRWWAIMPGQWLAGVTVAATVALQVSPKTASVITGRSFQFTPNVSGTTNLAVRWSIDTPGAASVVGTIDASSGLYTAPASVPAGSITVRATSVEDPRAQDTAQITVASITVDIQPSTDAAPVAVVTGAHQQFNAVVNGVVDNNAVNWLVVGGAGNGSITAGGYYTAPNSVPSPDIVNISATSKVDPVKGHTARVQVKPNCPSAGSPDVPDCPEGKVNTPCSAGSIYNKCTAGRAEHCPNTAVKSCMAGAAVGDTCPTATADIACIRGDPSSECATGAATYTCTSGNPQNDPCAAGRLRVAECATGTVLRGIPESQGRVAPEPKKPAKPRIRRR